MKQSKRLTRHVLLTFMASILMAVGAQAQDMLSTPLTLEAVEAGTINIVNPNALTIEYTKNGAEWTAASSNPISISVAAGDQVQLRGDNPTYCLQTNTGEAPTQITATNDIYVYGNVMSLISSTGFATLTTLPKVGGDEQYDSDNTFAYLFTTSGEYLDPVINTTIRNHPTKDIVLPALNVTRCGYMYMFARCKNLTRAPELPATELGWGCYHQMFCSTAIEQAPVLPAANVPADGYSSMFDQCANLNYVKCLATDISAQQATYGWLHGVAATGTFVKADGMTDWTAGPQDEWGRIDGIPTGWTVVNASEEVVSMTETPLTFEAVEAGTIKVYLDENAVLEPIEYQVNGGAWTTSTWGTAISLSAKDVISFRGDNGTCYTTDEQTYWAGLHFETSNNCYVYGNMMSLIDKDAFSTNITLTKPYTFFHIFQRSDYEKATTILNHPTKDIVLPATTLAPYCYDGLFADAPNISRAPELPATTLTEWCYSEMFNGTSITTAPELPATTLAKACYSDMFMNCTSLTTAPDLPAPTLVEGCYSSMFSGCTSLNYVKCLATDISANYPTVNWLDGVAATGIFVKAAGMESWTIGPQGDPGTVDGIPSGWTVVPNTEAVTANSDGEGSYWATYYNGDAGYQADENTKVYTVKVDGDQKGVTMTEVADKVVPQGNAVVLVSANSSITMTHENRTDLLANNDLLGAATAITTPANTYMLVDGTQGVGFYHWMGTEIPARKGYLTLSSSATARTFLPLTDSTSTRVETSATERDSDDSLYDLTGRRLNSELRKGIYVRNGKKIVIK